MSNHTKHIATNISKVGNYVEETLELGEERANFLVLAWTDTTLQCVTNTPRAQLIHILRTHLESLESGMLRPGPANGGH